MTFIKRSSVSEFRFFLKNKLWVNTSSVSFSLLLNLNGILIEKFLKIVLLAFFKFVEKKLAILNDIYVYLGNLLVSDYDFL